MRNLIAILFLAAILPASAQFAERWNAAADRPAPRDITVMRGETLAVEPLLTVGGAPADLTGTTATFYWQTNGMDAAWWSSPATVSATETGRVSAVWSHANDVGATAYTWFIGLDRGGTATAYRAFGRIAMRPSPGFNPSVLPPPSAYPTLAAELAPLVAPLITVTETDPAALAVLATQRVERVWSPDATEYRDGTGGVWRVVSVPQGYWTLSVLGTEYGTATNAYYEIRTAPFDFWNYNRGYGDGDAYFSWHVNTENSGQGQIYVEIQGEEGAHDGFLETNQVASGSIDFATSIYHTMIRLAWSNQPPLIVTQHVDTVELKSTQAGPRLDLIEVETNKWRTAYGWGNHAQAGYATRAEIPAIVLSNSVSSLVVWTNATGAATNMAWRENGAWHTNALGGASSALPEGIITNGYAGFLTFGSSVKITDWNASFQCANGAEFNTVGLYLASGGGFSYWDISAGQRRWGLYSVSGSGDFSFPNGSLTVAGTNTAAELRSLGGLTLPDLATNTTAYLFISNNLMWVRGVTP